MICIICEKEREPKRFLASSPRMCMYCTPFDKKKEQPIDCKCMSCGNVYKALFKFGICDKCKSNEENKDFGFLNIY